MLLYVDVPMAK